MGHLNTTRPVFRFAVFEGLGCPVVDLFYTPHNTAIGQRSLYASAGALTYIRQGATQVCSVSKGQFCKIMVICHGRAFLSTWKHGKRYFKSCLFSGTAKTYWT
ncbi:MAG: hypothetical protein KFF68_09440, partial [Desulfosarcina sp.]|nr:hypothetical protein [Desulfosarcina sp.]